MHASVKGIRRKELPELNDEFAKDLGDYQGLEELKEVIRKNISDIESGTPRKRFTPLKFLPKPQQDPPVVYGVEPNYLTIGHLRVTDGRFFDAAESAASAPVCVLGAAAKDLWDLPVIFLVLGLLRFSEWWLRRKWGIV